MSNYNHIPLTDDSRFSGGVDIGDAQKIKGYYEIFEQFPVHYSLCRHRFPSRFAGFGLTYERRRWERGTCASAHHPEKHGP